jgi:signal transduction histidine kinase
MALGRAGAPFVQQDLAIAVEVGRRAGLALDNARLYLAAQDALRQRDEFLMTASHELKNPLSTLMLQVDLLRIALGAIPAMSAGIGDAFAALRAVDGQVARIAELVRDLLDSSRIGHRRDLHAAKIDLAALIDNLVSRLRPTGIAAGSEVLYERLPPIWGSWDAVRVEQILTNLLLNAFRHAPGSPVRVHVVALGSRVVVTVKDGGPGIPLDDLERVFERFVRTSTARGHGFGLGLWIARSLAEEHGGTLTVTSAPGKGATFILDLPMVPAGSAEGAVQAAG